MDSSTTDVGFGDSTTAGGFWEALVATVMIFNFRSCLLMVVFEHLGLKAKHLNYTSSVLFNIIHSSKLFSTRNGRW